VWRRDPKREKEFLLHTKWLIVSLVAALGFGCAGTKTVDTNDNADSDPADIARHARRAAWGPTSDAGFREPFGFQGKSIFDELNWPTPNNQRAGSGAPGAEYWQQQVDYAIEARLDTETKSIEASAIVTYHNNSPDALDYVWLHLEQNLFRPDAIGALANEPESRFGYRDGVEGGYNISSLTANGADLDLQVYDTMGRIDLPEPIQPGQVWSFEISWRFIMPEFGADRMAMTKVEDGTIYELAQWFPAVAKYDDVHGWNTLGYLGQGEFYTDFGDYDLKVTVPHDHIVVTSGLLQNAGDVLTQTQRDRLAEAADSEETVAIRTADEVTDPASRPEGDGELTWHFVGKQMRTFAWASSASFIWDAATIESGAPMSADGTTLVQAVYPKEAQDNWKDAVEFAAHAIAFNSEQWAPYPYPSATNVHGRVGGMEYPGIVFCGARNSSRGLYGVTDHEFGHNWFPMMVNSDERRYAWMDEGFNSFINMYTTADYYERDVSNRRNRGRRRRLVGGHQQPIMTYPDRMWRGRLGYLGYGKPAAGLFLLREFVLGHERFDRSFRTYIDRWLFKSPQPADFFRTMEDASGMDLAWFWRGWFYTNATLDQGIVGVEQLADYDGKAEGDQPWVFVDLVNNDEMVMPVRMEVTYDDGSMERRDLPVEIWTTSNQWTTGWNPGSRTVTRVVLDPDKVLPDTDRDNNAWGEVPSEDENDASSN
jgi:Peptidase family M1 domain